MHRFHLLFIFLRLIIFGALAATTRGSDVTNYITLAHSPGSTELETYDIMTLTPDRYSAERLTKISLRVIMLVLGISRVLLLLQHLRVLIYARLTAKSGRFPRQLFIVPALLVISAGLFFRAFAMSMSRSGREPFRAKVKFALWGVALLVEIVAHILRFQMEIDQGVRLRSHGSITGLLNNITTIIIGELSLPPSYSGIPLSNGNLSQCINAISGTFYALQQAPGFRGPTGTAIICCGVIVFFLAYVEFCDAARGGSRTHSGPSD